MKKLVIEVTPVEVRGAVIDGDRVVEVHSERKYEKGIVGNIYKGKISRVIKGLKAVFVDIGLEKAAYMNFEDLKDSFKQIASVDEGVDFRKEFDRFLKKKLKPGDEVIVQVTRDVVGDKGPKVTTNIAIPGKYIVLLPFMNFIGVSRKIEDQNKRRKLKELVSKELQGKNIGVIIRTSAENIPASYLKRELKFLLSLLKKIEVRMNESAPRILYQDIPLSLKLVRDYLDEDLSKIYVDDREEYRKIKDIIKVLAPSRSKDVVFYSKGPVFSAFGLRDIYDRVMRNVIWLPSGGYIVIQETEALTSIDVNSGKFTPEGDPEEMFLKINREAAEEIAHQLRLRDVGGIIIVDFVNMRRRKNRQILYEFFRARLLEDQGKPEIERISRLGLVEMTRKKEGKSLASYISIKCPYCDGRGYIKSPDTIVGEIYRDLKELFPDRGCRGQSVKVRVHPEVFNTVNEKYSGIFSEICRDISFVRDENLHMEKFLIEFK